MGQVEDWVRGARTGPFFLFLHTYRAHDYCPSEEAARRFVEETGPALSWKDREAIGRGRRHVERDGPELRQLRQRYDATVFDVDRELGEFLEFLAGEDLLDRSVVVVTSDHGEAFLEHDEIFHRAGLWEELLRVPLLIRVPGRPAATISTPVSLVDLAPTALALLGLNDGVHASGRDVSLATGAREPDPVPILAHDFPAGGDAGHALIQGGRKLIDPASRGETGIRLFDLEQDPGERLDLAATRGEEARHLQGLLERLVAEREADSAVLSAVTGPATLDADLAEDLAQLGYVDDLR
jgi:arylsulfatase A-like enzyme